MDDPERIFYLDPMSSSQGSSVSASPGDTIITTTLHIDPMISPSSLSSSSGNSTRKILLDISTPPSSASSPSGNSTHKSLNEESTLLQVIPSNPEMVSKLSDQIEDQVFTYGTIETASGEMNIIIIITVRSRL